MKKVRKGIQAVVAGLWAMVLCGSVYAAAQPGEILSFGTEDTNIVLFLQNPGEEYELRCQVGTSEAEKIESHRITEEDIPMETIILIDNSLSVAEKYRPFIRETLSELAANRMEGERFTVAVFSDQLSYLLQDCTDYMQVRQTVEDITYQNQETYLTDILYELLTDLNEKETSSLRRIVIVSDGVDNKYIGYTKEELYAQLEKTPYPIYTLGCTYKENNEALKNMFVLSRMTGGESWLLDEVSEPLTIVNGIAAVNQAVKVTVTPKKAECDGTKKGISIEVAAEGGDFRDSVELLMPFTLIEETAADTEVPAKSVTVMETTQAKEEETDAMKSVFPLPLLLVGVVVILVGGGIVAAVIIMKEKKEEAERFVSAPFAEPADKQVEKKENRITEFAGAGKPIEKKDTVYLWKDISSHTLTLADVSNPARSFEVSLEAPVLVGYNGNCQICLNYDETVSGEHCLIYREGGKYYVQNKSRTNGTLLNGKKIVECEEIDTGCVLGIGRLRMKVSIL